MTIRRPAQGAAVLRVAGGASQLVFDGQRFGAIGGETRLETPGGRDAADRYEIEILGGASKLTVAERDAS